jgi:ribosomal protein S18 acetylase RimI-like enzyme
MIRPATPDDTATLIALTDATGVFKPREIEALQEVLDDYHAVNHSYGHQALVLESSGDIQGYSYHAPAAMTDRTWYLYWIAVAVPLQGQGHGSLLLQHVEATIAQAKGRMLLIETSSLPHYEPTRRFYLKANYQQMATVEGYYADGDDMVIFGKRLS